MHVDRLETDPVIAAVGRAESEFAVCRALLRYDAVVVVEDFVYADVDAHFVVRVVAVCVFVVERGLEVACEILVGSREAFSERGWHTDYEGVLGELLDEAFLCWAIDVEMQCRSLREQRGRCNQERGDEPHCQYGRALNACGEIQVDV